MITTTAKRIAALALLLAVLAVPALALAAPAVAQEEGPGRSERVAVAREFCREIAEQGGLDEAGATFGECVNILGGPASEQATNFVAGLCGLDFAQEITDTTSKGQCIKVLREAFSQQP